ncbi:hypothetical protein GCM10011610_00690 [Nocardia rhizosphaerihabitans]|uniref:DUF222 domain-containing protein n=1 Tax=Nocardia rhizosphaerihabitans TaxID=1691570 RepID=A0ABQ2K7G9_9NOCA|nr:hypothetical protein GCM10011610_00690 [Nocardia rhizosphaerihabitans]
MTDATETFGTASYSAVHRRMAYAIQNVTADLTILSGEPAIEPHARKTVRDLSIAHRVLHEQAAAIGVPANWIDHASDAGRRSERTTGESTLPTAHDVPRSMLIAQLRHQVESLHTLPALASVRRDRGLAERRGADRLSEHLRLQWLRVAMTATAIDATEAETRGLWGIDPKSWQPRLAAVADRLDLEGGRPWRAVTAPAVLREARCRVAVMRMVGITLTDSPAHQLPPAPHLLEASSEHAWQTRDRIERPAGELIGAAIEATGVTAAYLDHAEGGAHYLPPPTASVTPVSELDL